MSSDRLHDFSWMTGHLSSLFGPKQWTDIIILTHTNLACQSVVGGVASDQPPTADHWRINRFLCLIKRLCDLYIWIWGSSWRPMCDSAHPLNIQNEWKLNFCLLYKRTFVFTFFLLPSEDFSRLSCLNYLIALILANKFNFTVKGKNIEKDNNGIQSTGAYTFQRQFICVVDSYDLAKLSLFLFLSVLISFLYLFICAYWWPLFVIHQPAIIYSLYDYNFPVWLIREGICPACRFNIILNCAVLY